MTSLMPPIHAPMARSALHQWHVAHGARFAEWDGWETVRGYASVESEVTAARTGLALADVSALAKVSIRGPGVPSFAQSLVGSGPALDPRRVATVLGGSAWGCRLTHDHLFLLAWTPKLVVAEERLGGLSRSWPLVQMDVSSAYAGFVLLGPDLETCLSRLSSLDVRPESFGQNSCAETALARVEALLVRPGGMSVPVMQVYVAWEFAEFVWERICEATPNGPVTPVGLEALIRLGYRAESCLAGGSDSRS